MFFGIMFAFAIAVINWLTNRFLIPLSLTIAEQTTFVMVPPCS
jgi:hypothetical protein